MTCKPDGTKVFEQEQIYTTQCEACQFFVKVDRYRACEARHAWNASQGIDVFAQLRDVDRAAKYQMGSSDGLQPTTQSAGLKKIPSRHRGR